MICLGYIDEVIKGVSNGVYGRYLTRYKATNKLIKKFLLSAYSFIKVSKVFYKVVT
jgi:hypothetical protein